MKLSFVIPCYRSEKTIIPVLEEIQDKMREKIREIRLRSDHCQ